MSRRRRVLVEVTHVDERSIHVWWRAKLWELPRGTLPALLMVASTAKDVTLVGTLLAEELTCTYVR